MTHETNTEQEIARARELLAQAEGVPTHWVDSEWKGKMCSQDVAISAICAALRTASQGECQRCDGDGVRFNNAAQEVTECGSCKPATPASASEADPDLLDHLSKHLPSRLMDRVSAALAASEATLRHRLTWIKDISTVGPMSEIEREKVHRFVAEALAIIESPAPASGEPAHDREAAMIGLEYVMTLLDGATPGPWMWSDNGNIIPEAYSQDCEIAAVYTNREDDAAPVNASAIIAAVNWLRKHGRTLRAADNCDAAGVQTVKREPKP